MKRYAGRATCLQLLSFYYKYMGGILLRHITRKIVATAGAGSAGESHVPLAVAVLKSIGRPITKSALVGPVTTLPSLVAVLEHHRRIIITSSNNLHRPGESASHAQSLGVGVDRCQLRSSDLLLGIVEYDNVEGVVVADAELVALVLDDVLQEK